MIKGEEIRVCSVCGEALEVETIHPVLKTPWLRPRACMCMREQREKEDREIKARMHDQLVEKNRNICFAQKRQRDIRFDNDNTEFCQEMSLAKRYVDNWEEVKPKNSGLLFWGGVGAGKSYTAACIANELLDQEQTVYMTNFTSIINKVFSEYNKSEYVKWLCDFDLLIIDDLGVERHTEYGMENLFWVIDSRLSSGKPMIITTNHTLEELKNPKTLDERRIYDRVLSACVPVCFDGESRRVEQAEEKKKNLGEIFNREG